MRYTNEVTGLIAVEKITKHITLLKYQTREQLCEALCRFSESAESPEFAGKVFTLGQYREWYSDFYGAWMYYQNWSGFNIPSSAFLDFFSGRFDPLATAEKEVVDLFRYKQGKFCIIGTYEGCESDVYDHEICHAMFATISSYKDEVLQYLSTIDTDLADLKKFVTDLGYGDNVLLDECHAYMSESWLYLQDNNVNFPEKATETLQAIKAKYLGEMK